MHAARLRSAPSPNPNPAAPPRRRRRRLRRPPPGTTGWMPHPRPLDVVVGAPLEFDLGRMLGGEADQETGLEKLVDAYHAQ
jgi:hypothetical protein